MPVVARGQLDAAITKVECGAHVRGKSPTMWFTPMLALQRHPVYDSWIFSRVHVPLWLFIYIPTVTDIAVLVP